MACVQPAGQAIYVTDKPAAPVQIGLAGRWADFSSALGRPMRCPRRCSQLNAIHPRRIGSELAPINKGLRWQLGAGVGCAAPSAPREAVRAGFALLLRNVLWDWMFGGKIGPWRWGGGQHV